ncbi:hypothetical protein LI216_12495 [Mediterraneibacter glycyrrhizinilyticus]|uniref:hypothetical protein n=1 Tax=Mediterraneibacter glycyrrhizinilyticus TaxID=342942 RepID=UPI001D09039D|nr:hypothetical protein [Mediterraneibacter glycyrrhizinilyticus]MCB6310383.1 hypothetical protein [Lachnospiraceae bacterium 210521-DFI.1.109]MCB6427883.1 hypothetical protein [Mediterraneibacter glycyrrhizinilyticus]
MQIEVVENTLFNVLGIALALAIIFLLIWWILEALNRLFKISKYIIMYHEYKRREDLYDLKNKLIVSKDGSISYSCVGDIDEQIDILDKAIKERKKIKKLREERSS